MSLSSNLDFLSSAVSAVTVTHIIPKERAYSHHPRLDLGSLHARTLQWSQDKDDSMPPRSKRVRMNPAVDNLFVINLNGYKIGLNVRLTDSIESLISKIQDKEAIPSYNMRLMFEGRRLEEGRLNDYGIQLGDTLLLDVDDGGSLFSMDEAILDQEYNCDFSNMKDDDGETYVRGGRKYFRPYGWNRVALNVKDKYDDTEWIGGIQNTTRTEGVIKEWPVTYHGTEQSMATKIASGGYDLGKGKRFSFGRGIYSTPDPAIAEDYATIFNFRGQKYKVLLQNRVNMEDTDVIAVKHSVKGDKIIVKPLVKGDCSLNGEYFVTAREKSIRPYGLLFKKV